MKLDYHVLVYGEDCNCILKIGAPPEKWYEIILWSSARWRFLMKSDLVWVGGAVFASIGQMGNHRKSKIGRMGCPLI